MSPNPYLDNDAGVVLDDIYFKDYKDGVELLVVRVTIVFTKIYVRALKWLLFSIVDARADIFLVPARVKSTPEYL